MKALRIVMLFATCATAEIPPLSPEDRAERAETIVVGRVTSIDRSDETSFGSDYVREILMIGIDVEAVEKGEVRANQKFSTWRTKRTPEGWVGPGGQSVVPKVGDRVRVFTTRLESRTLSLLQPNGCEILKATTQPATRPAADTTRPSE